MITAVLFIVLLLVLVIPHEAGHMIVAKLCGVCVEEFSVGMGPCILKKKIGETLYSLRLLPLGGFCRMRNGDEEGSDPDDPRAFRNKTAAQKIAILCAGIMMNVILAWIILTGIAAYTGVATNTLSDVVKGSPAYEAGISAGETIVEINGSKTPLWADTLEELSYVTEDELVEMKLKSESRVRTVFVTPEYDSKNDRTYIGIVCSVSRNPVVVARAGLESTVELNSAIVNAFLELFRGKADKDSVGGPVKIVQVVDEARSYGALSYLMLVAMISLNLAIFNILPIPSLDGARILFVIVRLLSGGRITEDMENYVHVAGMLFLIMLMILITVKDIMGLF